jgi:hypothetical protein
MEVAKMGSNLPEPFGTPSIPSSVDHEHLVLADANDSSLLISKSLVEALWAHAKEGLRALAHGGLEVGGLLVGPKVRDGKILVEDVIPLVTEYQFGPSFQMSESDLANLAAAIESVQADPEQAVVGFFRSRARGEGTLRECDFEVLKAIEQAHSSFADDFRCCFILAPVPESTALACIAMRYGAGWWELPVRTLHADPLSVTIEQAAPLESPEAPPVADQEVRRDAGSASSGSWSYAAAAFFALGIAIGAYHFLTKQGLAKEGPPKEGVPDGEPTQQAIARAPASIVPVSNPTPSSRLKFTATRNGLDLKLTWDRAAIDALNPEGAVLTIQDGGFQRQVPLSRAELASGILYYTARSHDLLFSLRINGSDVEEHVRVLDAPALIQGPPPQLRIDAQAAAATKSRLAKIMAAHAAAAAANPDSQVDGPSSSPNEGEARSNPTGAP